MKWLVTLLSILFIISFVNGDYSIGVFIDYLQNEEYYDLFQEIKTAYGGDVAIDICKGFVSSNDCEILVKVYMPSNSPSEYHPNPIDSIEIEDEEEKAYLENLINSINKSSKQKYEKIMTLINIFLRHYDILRKKYETTSERLDFIKEVIKKL